MTDKDLEFMSLLRCPRTGERLRREEAVLVSERGDSVYPVRDGVCVLLCEAAEPPVLAEEN